MKRITILYSELADYSIACFRSLAANDSNVLLFHWPINPEAPFNFELDFCESFNRTEYSDSNILEKIVQFEPDLILCSGWLDKGYMRICKFFNGRVPTILSMDNHWVGSLKQHVATMVSPFTIQKAFSHAYVPGSAQLKYALKLGFASDTIKTGFYTADVARFNAYYEAMNKDYNDPVRFLYLGRYIEHKGIFDLWKAFEQLTNEGMHCELWCVGTGDAYDSRVEAKGIRHFGFIQPAELLPILKDCHAYILPSHFEPWGVSVHEMAAAGFPLLISDAIGAKEDYLGDGVNGFKFETGSVLALKNAMKSFIDLTPEQRKKMAQVSRELSKNNSPIIWVNKLLSFID